MKTTCLPLHDETAASLTLRVACKTGLSLQEFCQLELGLSHSQATSDLDQLLPRLRCGELAKFSGTDEQRIRDMLIPRDWVESTWDRKRRRHQAAVHVCTKCLKENFYGRRFWRTRFAIACPIHGVEMTCRCPQCEAMVTYFSTAEEPLVSHWMESFPTCRNCMSQIEDAPPAHPIMLEMSRYWASALEGQVVLAFSANDFLRLSVKCIRRFTTVPQYRTVLRRMHRSSQWPEVEASALLLHALLHGPISTAIFHAAIGSKFQPSSLAEELRIP